MNRKSIRALRLLRDYESPNVTFQSEDGTWPVVWERAKGMHVWDAAGRRYVDLTGAFGVAACGHAHPGVVRAGRRQMGRLLHAMGDVHPHALKGELARELSRATFERWGAGRGRTVFCNSGFEAVEAALKTALLATGRRRVLAFEGAYHGLGHGALSVTHRDEFRRPFLGQLGRFATFVPYPTRMAELGALRRKLSAVMRRLKPGAILAEPIQGRGGIRVPPTGFLQVLRDVCDRHGALLVLDEIYTGFGRTGRWFACEAEGVVPDAICLGKALAGGFPISACVGRSEVMERAWPWSSGEALHTSTFLGHPVGCAMALAQLNELRRGRWVRMSDRRGALLRKLLVAATAGLSTFQAEVRGRGLMVGVELRDSRGAPATGAVFELVRRMLASGYILLPEGEHGEVIGFTPPLVLGERQMRRAVSVLAGHLQDLDRRGVRATGATRS